MAKKKQTATKKKETPKRISAAFIHNGQRYYVKGYSKKEIDDKIYQKRLELDREKEDRENPTLNNYYKKFTDNRRLRIKESTLRIQTYQFRNCADIVIDPQGRTLGEYHILDIRPDDIQCVQTELAQSGRTTETVNNCIDHLRHVFNQAVKSRYISSNPCDAVQNIKRTEPKARDTIHRALTKEEQKKFFEEARKSKSHYYNHFATMIKTGIRVGELAALLPFDLNTKAKELHISKTLSRDEIGNYIINDTPKTEAGNRFIPVTDDVVRIIKEQCRKTIDNPFNNPEEPQIFKTAEGTLLREYPINREIARICKRAGIDRITCHAFRATFATRWIEQQPQRYKELSEILGHANTKITLDLYAHSMKDTKIEAMNAVTIAI